MLLRDTVYIFGPEPKTKVLALNGKYGLVVDASPTLVKTWPLKVQDVNVGGKTVLATRLTYDNVSAFSGLCLQDPLSLKANRS